MSRVMEWLQNPRNRIYAVVGITAVVIAVGWIWYYNSPQQKLERCVNAQRYNTEWRPGIDESYKVIYCKMHVGIPINQQPSPND